MSKPSWVDVWYDKNVRSWCIQLKTENGDQFEDNSTYVYSKNEALEIEKYYIKEFSLDLKHSRMKQKEHKEYLKISTSI